MAVQRSLISPTAHPRLEDALRLKLQRRGETAGSLGELEPLAVQLGLIQNTLKPRLKAPQLVVFAGDHGIVADGLTARGGGSSAQQVTQLLDGRLPIAVFSLLQGVTLTVVDAGLADTLVPTAGLQQRKIGFGTRSARLGNAMTIDQAHAAIRAGMELADTLTGNVLACAGIGLGSHESAALVLSRVGGLPLADLLATTADTVQPSPLSVLEAALAKHANVSDPVEVLAALGGYELAMMVGAMLVAASKRHLLIVDGVPACAALLLAARIAAPVIDYAVFSRSHGQRGLDTAMTVFGATAMLELGLQTIDGTGAALCWPLIHSAAALLTDVIDGEDSGLSQLSPTVSASTLELPRSAAPGA